MSRGRRLRGSRGSKTGRWKKYLWIFSLSCVFLVGLIFVGSYFYVKFYVQSESFRDLLQEKAVDDLNVSQAHLDPLVLDGSGVRCKEVAMSGHEFLKQLDLTSLEVDINRSDLWNRRLSIDNLAINHANVVLQLDKAKFEEKPKSGKGWVERNILPLDFEIQTGHINDATVVLLAGPAKFSLKNTRLSLDYDASTNYYQLDLKGGDLNLPWKIFSKLSLVQAGVLYHYASGRWIIPSCRLTVNGGGYVDIKGEYMAQTNAYSSNIVLHDLSCSGIFPESIKNKLLGRMNGSVEIRDSGKKGDRHVSGLLELSDASITDIPLLDVLAKFCKNDRFKSLKLNQAKAKFQYSDKTWHLKDIVLESVQLIRVEGNVQIADDGDIAGLIKIGLRPDGGWEKLPGFSSVFTSENNNGKNGLVWANVNLGGTLKDPTEDLSARLIKAAGLKILSVGVDMLLNASSEPDSNKKTGDDVGDMLRSLLGDEKSPNEPTNRPISPSDVVPIKELVPAGGKVLEEGLKILNL